MGKGRGRGRGRGRGSAQQQPPQQQQQTPQRTQQPNIEAQSTNQFQDVVQSTPTTIPTLPMQSVSAADKVVDVNTKKPTSVADKKESVAPSKVEVSKSYGSTDAGSGRGSAQQQPPPQQQQQQTPQRTQQPNTEARSTNHFQDVIQSTPTTLPTLPTRSVSAANKVVDVNTKKPTSLADKKESVVPSKVEVSKSYYGSTNAGLGRVLGFKIPKRPDFGTEGKTIQLKANFFEIKIPDTDIHHYDVTIKEGSSVDKTPKDVNRRVIEKLVNDNLKVFGTRPVFDGKKNLYTKKGLPFQGTREFTVELPENDRKRILKVALKWAAQVNLLTLEKAVKGECSSINQDAVQALDLVLRHASSLRYIPVGSKFFTSVGSVNIGYGREVWHGYHQSVRPTRWKMMINIDVSATTFYREVQVIEYLYDITTFDCTKHTTELKDADRNKFSKEIKGLKIEITYMGKQRRKYRVNGLTRLPARRQTFPCEKDGKTIQRSVEDYFKLEKNVVLKYPFLPCLHVGDPKKNIYIPMECCKLAKGQQCKKKLSDELVAEMIKQTARRPHERMKTIMEKVHGANFPTDPYIKGFGVQVDRNMANVEGRVLPTPEILYQGEKTMRPDKGAWNMRGLRLYKGATINSWGLVVFDCNKRMRQDEISKFQGELIKAARTVGITMNNPVYQRIANYRDPPATIVEEAIRKNTNIELLVVILPGKTPFYGDLKRICETENGYTEVSDPSIKKVLKERGLRTQCIQSKNASKCNPMTLAQLCLKINAKMGGVNNAIGSTNKITRPVRVFSEPVIFLGADVTHPAAGDRESPSIAAVVGSVDSYPIRYAVSVRIQKHRVEIIEDLENITKELLKQFYINLRVKPKKLVMFRDGVSEGQFQQVLLHEMTAIQRACTSLEKGYQPGITFIIVQKRHHARFFVKNRDDADRSGNCPPGTTIDTGVCHPSEFDYYQYSHAGIQGTSRPTHYHLLYDDNEFKADELQALSFMLCHLYVRCTRSVSIPAPAYYAHHVAFRARYHLQRELGSTSSDTSDSADLENRMSALQLKEIVKPHPKMLNMMYFV